MRFVFGVAAVLLLSGCTTGPDEAMFLDLARDTAPQLRSLEDPVLLGTGYATCEGLDDGLTFGEVLLAYTSEGLSGRESGALTGAAVNALCPDHTDAMEEYYN